MSHFVPELAIVLWPDERQDPDPSLLAGFHQWLGSPLACALLTQSGLWPLARFTSVTTGTSWPTHACPAHVQGQSLRSHHH
jgi:hypothetical protein